MAVKKPKTEPATTHSGGKCPSDRLQQARSLANKVRRAKQATLRKEKLQLRKVEKKIVRGGTRKQRRWGISRQHSSTPANTVKLIQLNVEWETLHACGLV